MSKANGNTSMRCVNSAALICTAPLVKLLTEARIPPNYVGVRRIRLSRQPLPGPVKPSEVVFKVVDADGKERRMNRQEKKALKQKLALEKKLAKKGKKRPADEIEGSKEDTSSNDTLSKLPARLPLQIAASSSKYHSLSVSQATLEQEMAELRGERGGLPPVLLSPPMAVQAHRILPEAAPKHDPHASDTSISCWIQYDPVLSADWAQALSKSMQPATVVRQSEDMRPMAYQLTPEPWTRLRSSKESHPKLLASFPSTVFNNFSELQPSTFQDTPARLDWINVTCRPPTTKFDLHSAAVFDYLHKETDFHVSCGAKFGSDLLIYDGPRDERHAFAGMRILTGIERPATPSEQIDWPLPTAYSLAGYVRCLNTAGKLALLATVVEESLEDGSRLFRVVLVDVALEKILSAPTHQKNSRTEKRRDVMQNLAKPVK